MQASYLNYHILWTTILSLDSFKAFDRVKWPFLFYAVEKLKVGTELGENAVHIPKSSRRY